MTRITAIVATCALVVAACGGTDDTGDTTTTTDTVTTTTVSTTTTTSSTTTTTEPTTTTTVQERTTEPKSSTPFPGEGDVAFLTSVEVTEGDDATRITWNFEDGATPSYRVEYVEPPITASPSGQQIDLEGSAFLQVTVSPGAGVDLSGDEPRETFTGEDRFTPDAEGVAELAETEDFETVLSWVVGVPERAPFSVTADQGSLTVAIATDSMAGNGGEDTVLAEADRCTSPEGYSISYPATWWVNDGSVTDACGLFGPEPVDLEPATDVTAPINVFVDPVAFEVAAEPTETGDELDRSVTSIDGARAVRTVTVSGDDAFYPEGTAATTYLVDLGTDGEERTMILTTVDLDAYDYEHNTRVLDAMVRTVDLEVDTPTDLVARYLGGGTPFDVFASQDGDRICFTVEPPGSETCLELPAASEPLVAATVGDVAVGLTTGDVYEVQSSDGLSFLPVPVDGTDAAGWALPVNGSTEISAFLATVRPLRRSEWTGADDGAIGATHRCAGRSRHRLLRRARRVGGPARARRRRRGTTVHGLARRAGIGDRRGALRRGVTPGGSERRRPGRRPPRRGPRVADRRRPRGGRRRRRAGLPGARLVEHQRHLMQLGNMTGVDSGCIVQTH